MSCRRTSRCDDSPVSLGELDPHDRDALVAVIASVEAYEPTPGNRLERVDLSGAHPNTVVTVVFETPRGSESRSYRIWTQFDLGDPAGIGMYVWADVAEHF
jgi:hypothetical protein